MSRNNAHLKHSQIRDRTGEVKRRVSRVSVDMISLDEKECALVTDWRGKRVETAIGGNKIRVQEISFQGIPNPRDFFHLRRSARRSNFRRSQPCDARRVPLSAEDVFPAGCCILNVFTLAPDPDRTLACLPFCALGISTWRTSVLLVA